jgi:hypothetical protein
MYTHTRTTDNTHVHTRTTYLHSYSTIRKILPHVVLDLLGPHAVLPLLDEAIDALLTCLRRVRAHIPRHTLTSGGIHPTITITTTIATTSSVGPLCMRL